MLVVIKLIDLKYHEVVKPVNMKNINKEILQNSLSLKEYLHMYGIDRFNVKEDLSLLSLISYILENHMDLSESEINILYNSYKYVLNNNSKLEVCIDS
jgi:hypothetical protein